MHTASRSVQQQPQKEQEKQHDHAGAITANQALDSNSSSTPSAARAPVERQQQQQHAPQRYSSNQNGRPRESNPQYQPQPGSHRDGTAPAASPELVRSRRDGQQDRAMQDSFRFKYTDQQPAQQPAAAGSSTGASQLCGVATQQQQHVVIGSAAAYEQPHAPNPYAVSMNNGHLAYHMAVAAGQAQPQVQSQLQQQQQQQVTFSVGTQPAYSSYSIAQVMPPQPARPPATFTLAEVCHSREFIMNRARTLGEQGGKRLELIMMPYLLQRLEIDRLPTNDVTLLQFAPDMMPVARTRPRDFLMVWTMWVKWAKTASIPSVPLVAPLVTFFLLDSVPTLEDRLRLVQILDSYRHSVHEVLSSLGGQHPNVVLPDWTQDRWTEWTEMLQTGRTSLFDWQAVREACGLGVPPAVAAGLLAPALSSFVPPPMITGPSFRPAIAAAPSAQQQQQHSPEQQRQQPSQQYQQSPPLAGSSTNPMGYYPPNAAPPAYPTVSTRPGISPLATYSTSASQQSSPVRLDSHGSNPLQQEQHQQQPRSMRPASFSGETTASLRELKVPDQKSRPTSARAALAGGTSHTTHAATQDAAVPPRAAPPVAPKSMPPTPLVSPTNERPPALHKQGDTRSSPAQVARRPSPPATSDFLRSFRTSVAETSASKQTLSSSAAAPANGGMNVAPPAESQVTPQRAQPAPFGTGSNGSKGAIPTSLAALQPKFGNGTPVASQQQQQQQQQSNRNASGTAPTMSRRSIGSSAEALTLPATRSEGHRAPTNSLDLAATNAQTRAAEAARLTAAEVRATSTPTSAAHGQRLPPPAQTSTDTTSAHSMSFDGTSTAPHDAATGGAVQNGSTGPDSTATLLGKRKRPSVTATVENWKRLAEEAPKTLPPQPAPAVSIAAPASSRAAAAPPQPHSAPMASNFSNAQAQTQSTILPSPIQQALSSLDPFAAGSQAAPPLPSAPPPPQAQALPGRAVNVQWQVPPPPPRAQLAVLQQQSDANMPPKKRARGRPKKTTEQQQQLVTMDATDEEFDTAVAAARGAIQAFETARTAYAEGWRANPATSRTPLPSIARSRVRASADVVSASPWRDGKKQVFGSTANPPLAIDEPYGDYVPNTKPKALPAPARLQRIAHLSDPLFITRPFPHLPANGGLPPVELHLTRKPCPATGRTMDLFAITPHPFYPYPAALKRLDNAEVDKALEHINKLVDSSAQRVDLDQAASTTASGDNPDERQRAQAIKTVLARHVRRAVQGSRPPELPEDLRSQKAPKLAKRTWKLVKKVYPEPTMAASTSSAAATASEGTATTAAAQPARPPMEAASSPPKQVRSSSATQSSRDGVAPHPPQTSKPAPGSEIAISSPTTAPLSRPDTPSSISAPLAEGSARTSSQAPIVAGGLSKPARPSLAAVGSPVSAPVVPGVRPRAKSIHGMRRVSSGPGVHPLAQLYATAPDTVRQELREMSVAVPGVPSDPVAAALAAAAKKIQPRRRSMSMTASPRLPVSHKQLAHPSPPLVPILLADVGASEELNVAKDTKGKARRLSVDPPHPKSGTSALGVTLDADTDAAVADSNSTNPADAMQIDSDEGAVRDEAADASVEVADSQPDEEDHRADADHAASASSSMFASAVSSVARAAGGALASAARAFMSGSGGGVPTARGPPVPGSPAANQPADAHKATSAKGGAGVPSESDKNIATAVPASKSTIAPAAASGKPRLKSTAFDGTRVRLPPLHMSTEPLHPCALRELAVKKRWMQASEPFRPFGP